MRGGQADDGLNPAIPWVHEKGWGLGLMTDSGGGFRGPHQPAASSVWACGTPLQLDGGAPSAPSTPAWGCPPWPGPAPLLRGRPTRRARPGARASINRSFLSAWGWGGGGGSCLELCYVLKKKKAKNLGHKPQTVLLSA